MTLAFAVSHREPETRIRSATVRPSRDNQPSIYTIIFRRAEPELLMAESDQCPLIRISLDMGNFKLVLNVASLQGERHRFAAPMVPFGENLCLLFTIVRFVLSRQFIKLRIDNFQALLCLNMIKNPALREKRCNI